MGVDKESLRSAWPIGRLLQQHGFRIRPGTARGRMACPFCQERDYHTPRPPFSFFEHGWHCFRCGEHGDVFALEMALSGCDFKTAAQNLSGGVPLEAPRDRVLSRYERELDVFTDLEQNNYHSYERDCRAIQASVEAGATPADDLPFLLAKARAQMERCFFLLEEERAAALYHARHQGDENASL